MRLPPLAEETKRRGPRELQRKALQEGGGQPKLAWMDRIPDDDQNFFFMLDAFAEVLGARLKRAQAEDKTLFSKGPLDSDNLGPRYRGFRSVGDSNESVGQGKFECDV